MNGKIISTINNINVIFDNDYLSKILGTNVDLPLAVADIDHEDITKRIAIVGYWLYESWRSYSTCGSYAQDRPHRIRSSRYYFRWAFNRTKLIIDNDYEVAADSYTVENGADPKVFLDAIESSKQVFNEYVSNVDEETRTNIENDPTYKLIMEQFDRRIDNLNKML